MNRKSFLKQSFGLAGVALASPVLLKSESFFQTGEMGQALDTLGCAVTETEVVGPYPILEPEDLVRTNIIGDRTGIESTLDIIIRNINAGCDVYENVMVDVWHCDADGNYSEYGEYSDNETHFLRGRQYTDSSGAVSFTTIFPGWYMGRATHIHVHIYKENGESLLVTQIAYPEGTDSAVYIVNTEGSEYGYTQGMNGYTYNNEDNIFSDGTDTEMATVTGSIEDGYTMALTIYVDGDVMGTDEVLNGNNFTVMPNYPNPFRDETIVPLVLSEGSNVTIELYDGTGRKITTVLNDKFLSAGKQEIKILRNQLKSGVYFATISVRNSSGKFKDNLKIMVK